MRLTIIIPVYNREKTIKRAIDSIIDQLEEDMELMLINDGSTDHTETIIQEYLLKDKKKISYYRKENEGVAATRNFAIRHAKGEYIMFVDSDDYIEKDFFQSLKTYVQEEVDMIKFKAKHVDEQGNVIDKVDGPVFSNVKGEDAFNKLAFTDVLMDSPCVYVFKKDLFVKNNLFFRMGTYHEDFGLIPLVLLMANSVVSLDIYGYNYVQTDNSITRNTDYQKTRKRLEDTLLHYDNMLQLIQQFPIQKKTQQNVKRYYTNAILLKLKPIHKADRKEYIKQIKKRKMIKNIRPNNMKQLIKRVILSISINWYLKWV